MFGSDTYLRDGFLLSGFILDLKSWGDYGSHDLHLLYLVVLESGYYKDSEDFITLHISAYMLFQIVQY